MKTHLQQICLTIILVACGWKAFAITDPQLLRTVRYGTVEASKLFFKLVPDPYFGVDSDKWDIQAFEVMANGSEQLVAVEQSAGYLSERDRMTQFDFLISQVAFSEDSQKLMLERFSNSFINLYSPSHNLLDPNIPVRWENLEFSTDGVHLVTSKRHFRSHNPILPLNDQAFRELHAALLLLAPEKQNLRVKLDYFPKPHVRVDIDDK